jgi:hypothetical protein
LVELLHFMISLSTKIPKLEVVLSSLQPFGLWALFVTTVGVSNFIHWYARIWGLNSSENFIFNQICGLLRGEILDLFFLFRSFVSAHDSPFH